MALAREFMIILQNLSPSFFSSKEKNPNERIQESMRLPLVFIESGFLSYSIICRIFKRFGAIDEFGLEYKLFMEIRIHRQHRIV